MRVWPSVFDMAVIKTINILSAAIESVFGSAPITKDLTEGAERPCTYITPTDVSVKADCGYIREDISVTITRFAEYTYKGYLDLLRWCETLEIMLTSPVMGADGYALYPEGVSMDINRDDMVLECSFTVTNENEPVYTEGEQGESLMAHLKAKYNGMEMI